MNLWIVARAVNRVRRTARGEQENASSSSSKRAKGGVLGRDQRTNKLSIFADARLRLLFLVDQAAYVVGR